MTQGDIINFLSEVRFYYINLDKKYSELATLGDINTYTDRDLQLMQRFKDFLSEYSIDKVTEGNKRTVYSVKEAAFVDDTILEVNNLLPLEAMEILQGFNTIANSNMYYNLQLN